MKLRHIHSEDMLQPVLREARTDVPGLDDLLKSGIEFVIVGAVAVNVYADRPRNTRDIDVLTTDYTKLADYIKLTFPSLIVKKSEVSIRFEAAGKEIIDIIVPYNNLFKSVLTDVRRVGRFSIPSPEALIALKFAAIMAAHRNLRQKGQDRLDIATIIANHQVDDDKIKEHLALLYPQAPGDFEAFITKLKQDFGLESAAGP